MPPRAAKHAPPKNLVLLCAAAWAVPGAGHFWLGKQQKAIAFFLALMGMFALGLAIDGCLFPVVHGELFVALSGLADVGIGLPYVAASLMGLGEGNVRAVTYEYGNTYLIVAGLLNALVVFDAYDIGVGRK